MVDYTKFQQGQENLFLLNNIFFIYTFIKQPDLLDNIIKNTRQYTMTFQKVSLSYGS